MLLEAENIAKDTVFTLLMRNNDLFAPSRRILFKILARCIVNVCRVSTVRRLNVHMLLCRSCTHDLNERILRLINQLSRDLTSRSMKEIIELSAEFDVGFQEVCLDPSHCFFPTLKSQQTNLFSAPQLFLVKDSDGNNLLMDLAKKMKDDALRELLTNHRTANTVV